MCGTFCAVCCLGTQDDSHTRAGHVQMRTIFLFFKVTLFSATMLTIARGTSCWSYVVRPCRGPGLCCWPALALSACWCTNGPSMLPHVCNKGQCGQSLTSLAACRSPGSATCQWCACHTPCHFCCADAAANMSHLADAGNTCVMQRSAADWDGAWCSICQPPASPYPCCGCSPLGIQTMTPCFRSAPLRPRACSHCLHGSRTAPAALALRRQHVSQLCFTASMLDCSPAALMDSACTVLTIALPGPCR